MNILDALKDIKESLETLEARNDSLQKQFPVGTNNWHSTETIDDLVHAIQTQLEPAIEFLEDAKACDDDVFDVEPDDPEPVVKRYTSRPPGI